MSNRLALVLLLATSLLFSAGSARAANILSFTPDTQSELLGNPVSIVLEMDFDDPTIGGSMMITYDSSILSLTSIVFDADLEDDLDLRCPGSTWIDCEASGPDFLSFGNAFDPLDGQLTIATLTFDTLDLGMSEVSATIIDQFVGDSTVTLTVTVTPAAVTVIPEPRTLALLSLGLLGLAVLSNHR